VRIGCTLPTFREDAGEALAFAEDAEAAGLDGVFAFDHIWPMGQPGRPAIAGKLLLGAIAAATGRIAIGTLVARIGLLPDATLLAELETLQAVSGGRLIAGLGTGDRKSDDEQRAYGLAILPASDRRASMAEIGGELQRQGVEVWVGSGSAATVATARALGATLNVWDVAAAEVAAAAREGPTSWGGPLPHEPAEAGGRLARFAEAGATWAVWAWPRHLDEVHEALEVAGLGAR
jgi:alkanesulfonate monooxygenase SsuD/methylene tetrahydromethanopterin reductase-like flavin-dependent oxidoreductase (luciferase family)